MKQVILFILLSVGSMISLAANAEETERVWYESSLENGGPLKDHMLEAGLATSNSVTLGALFHENWKLNKHELVVVAPKESLPTFFAVLFEGWIKAHNLIGTPETELSWEQVGEIGRQQGGFLLSTQADVDKALMITQSLMEIKTEESLSSNPQIAEVRAKPMVEESTPEAEAPVEIASAVSTPATPHRRFLPVTAVSDGAYLDHVRLVREPNLTDEEIEAKIRFEREEAEREAAEAAKREAEARAQAQNSPQAKVGSSDQSSPWWEYKPQHLMDARARWQRPAERRHHHHYDDGYPRSHTEAFLNYYFDDHPVMVEVARCESNFRNIQSEIPSGYGYEPSYGYYQIHEPTWGETARRIGFPEYKTNPEHNVGMARYIYETVGLGEWKGYPCNGRR